MKGADKGVWCWACKLLSKQRLMVVRGEIKWGEVVRPMVVASANCGQDPQWHYTQCGSAVLVMFTAWIVFAGDWACEIELRQTGVICFPWRQRSWSCGVFKSWISDARCPFQWKWQVLHNYDISVLQQVGMFFDGIACLMKVWPFSIGSSLVSRYRDAPLVHARISNVTS